MFLITHSGPFHCDEVISTAIFTLIYPECTILRTRDPKLIADLSQQNTLNPYYRDFFSEYTESITSRSDIAVYDVYGVHNPDENLFDHHQKEFTETFYDDKFQHVKMSSAGLVFKKFNKELSRSIMNNCKAFSTINIEEFLASTRYDEFLEHVYEDYFLSIDANDNGIASIEQNLIKHRNLSQIIDSYNKWGYFGDTTEFSLKNISTKLSKYLSEPEKKFEECNRRNASFDKATAVARQDLELYLRTKLHTFSVYYDLLLEQTMIADNYQDGKIVHWKNLEKKGVQKGPSDLMFRKKYLLKVFPDAKFFIESPEIEGEIFRIYGAPVDLVSYDCKAYLKQEWRGLQKDKLVDISTMENIEFVHSSGFAGGAKDFTTALRMCIESLE